jgi:signal recognition particle GTPase
MANKFNINELEGESVFNTPSEQQLNRARILLYNSNLFDENIVELEFELCEVDLSLERYKEIINLLEMNQADSPNPSMTEIKRQLEKRLNREL